MHILWQAPVSGHSFMFVIKSPYFIHLSPAPEFPTTFPNYEIHEQGLTDLRRLPPLSTSPSPQANGFSGANSIRSPMASCLNWKEKCKSYEKRLKATKSLWLRIIVRTQTKYEIKSEILLGYKNRTQIRGCCPKLTNHLQACHRHCCSSGLYHMHPIILPSEHWGRRSCLGIQSNMCRPSSPKILSRIPLPWSMASRGIEPHAPAKKETDELGSWTSATIMRGCIQQPL